MEHRLAAEDRESVTEYLFLPDSLFQADAAIVFGMSDWERPLARAIDLYRGGWARKLVFTGGYNSRIRAVEGVSMARSAADAGIPGDDILIEDTARHTGENVERSLRLLDQSLGIDAIDGVLLVTIHFHARRVLMTAERAFPDRIRLGTASYPSRHYSSENWHQSARGRADVYSEMPKIRRYFPSVQVNTGDLSPALAHGDALPAPAFAGVADALQLSCELFPEGAFTVFRIDGGSLTMPYRDVLSRALRILGGLQRLSVHAGDHIVLQLDSCVDFIPALWSCFLGGMIVVPALRHEASGQRSAAFWETLESGLALLDQPVLLTTSNGQSDLMQIQGNGCRIAALEEVEQASPGDPFQAAPGDIRLLVPSSGTTGRQRLVTLSDRAVCSRFWPVLPAADEAVSFLSWMPLDHVMGLSITTPNLPRKLYLPPATFLGSPLRWLEVLDRHRVTHCTMTNFGMSLILEELKAASSFRCDLSSVRKIGVGAEPISVKTCRAFIKALTPMGLRPDAVILGYGLTECGPVAGGNRCFSPAETRDRDLYVELDRPTRGHAVRIVNEQGNVLTEGEAGFIEVTGPTMAAGYLNDAGETAGLFTRDGWLKTGDLGVLRDRCLTVTGRAKEVISLNARKFSFREIEATAEAIPEVNRAYAVSFRQPRGNTAQTVQESLALFFQTGKDTAVRPDPVAEGVRMELIGRLGITPALVIRIEEGDLPRTATGKLIRIELSDRLARGDFGHQSAAPANQGAKEREYQAPGNPMEAELALLWETILQLPRVGANDNFLSLGGDSIFATRLIARIEERHGIRLKFDDLFDHPTLAELAGLIGRSVDEAC